VGTSEQVKARMVLVRGFLWMVMTASAFSLLAVGLATAGAAWYARRLGDAARDIRLMSVIALTCALGAGALAWVGRGV